MSRKPIIAANWKMNLTPSEAATFVSAFGPKAAGNTSVEIVLCPAALALDRTAAALKETGGPVLLGGQNIYPKDSGAYTGENSVAMLKDLGCTYVLVGHSERRTLFGETNAAVNEKIHFALQSGLRVIFCIGETLEQREANQTETILKEQVSEGLQGLDAGNLANMVIAYEPVWAIGTGKTATPEQAQDAHAFIRSLLVTIYDEETAGAMRIQYGGSVKPENANELLSKPDIDGALVGGASLKPDSFARIVNFETEGAVH